MWALPRGVGSCCWSWEKRIPVNRLGLQSCRGSGAAQEFPCRSFSAASFFLNGDVACSGSRKYSFLSSSAGTELAARTLDVSDRRVFLNGLMEGRLNKAICPGWVMESSSRGLSGGGDGEHSLWKEVLTPF